MHRSIAVIFWSIAVGILFGHPGDLHAQRRGGFDRRGGSDSDRRERMLEFFQRMREEGVSDSERRERMREFFTRRREDGGAGGGFGRASGSRFGGDSRFGRDRGSSRSSSSRRSKPKQRPRVTVDLPEKFKDRDKNDDGQIGLYEWERSAIAAFQALDRNGDGFLTPRELVSAENAGVATVATSSSRPAATSGSSTSGGGSSRSSERSTASTGSTSSSGDSRTVRFARYVFRSLDKDKDGRLTSDEWQQSQQTRQSFERQGVKLSFPVDFEGFVAVYPQRRG